MALAKDLVFVFLCHLLLLRAHSTCQKPFNCGRFSLEFPFSNIKDPGCGLVMVDGCDSGHPEILSPYRRISYPLLNMTPPDEFTILDRELQNQLNNHACYDFSNVPLSSSPFFSFTFSGRNLTLFSCYNQTLDEEIEEHFQNYSSTTCRASTVYYKTQATAVPAVRESRIPARCYEIPLPLKPNQDKGELFDLLNPEFDIEWSVSEDCYKCYHRGGECLSNSRNEFQCKEEKVIILLTAGSNLGRPSGFFIQKCVFAEKSNVIFP